MIQESEVSRQVLEEAPNRALTFLSGAGTSGVIRSILLSVGYTSEEHQQGWKLLHRVAGYTPAASGVTEDASVQRAVAELDAWDEPGFRRVRAALGHLHKPQLAFVFANDLQPATGPEAVLTVATMIARLDELEHGADRKSTRKDDHAALDTLAKRGITKEERLRLRGLVEVAQKGVRVVASPVDAADQKQRHQHLSELREWHNDWAETARSVLTRRDHLIRLGLAKRKKRKQAAPPEASPQ